ncbi:hypothetical protein V8D89_004006 [Ganoderma adspersum]
MTTKARRDDTALVDQARISNILKFNAFENAFKLQALKPGPPPDQPPPPVSSLPPTPPVPQPQSPSCLSPYARTGPPAAEYIMTDKDHEFCLALHKLRRDKMQACFGTAILHNLGPGLIMSYTMLEQIAECARAHKLRSLDDLYEETKWHETRELGDQVLELVSKYYPLPVLRLLTAMKT